MFKVAIVGDKDSVMAFGAIGIEVFEVKDSIEGKNTINKLALEGYGVIYVTEQTAVNIQETIDRYLKDININIVLIPSSQGTLGIGKQKLRDSIQKAIGMNIL